MFNDDPRSSSSRPAVHLLDELESIKGVLTDEGNNKALTEIPLLDDMVIAHLGDNAKLFNIEQIFDDAESAEKPPAAVEQPDVQFPSFKLDVAISDDNEKPNPAPISVPPRPRVRPDYSREVLIQELVDEFIPQIEIELQKRLRLLDDAALRGLKDSQ